MERIKVLFQQAMMISFGIIVGLAIQGVVSHAIEDSFDLMWYHPLSIVLAGFICTIPNLLLWSERELSKNRYYFRICLHFISLFIIVMLLGYVFKWYSVLEGAIWVAGEFVGIYAFVWIISGWLGLLNQRQINDALDSIRDEE